MGTSAAMSFRNSVRSLTLDTGDGNPHAVGINFMSNNQGTLKDVLIIAGDGDLDGEDGDGLVGIHLRTNEIGPCLLTDVEVRGFDRSVETESTQNSITMENIRLINPNVVGINNKRQIIFVRNLYFESDSGVRAVQNSNDGGSFVTLVDAEIVNTSSTRQGVALAYVDASNGVQNKTDVFFRNVRTENYNQAINVFTNNRDLFPPDESGVAYIDKYLFDRGRDEDVDFENPRRLWPNTERSLSLPIAEMINIPWGASDGWRSPLEFLTAAERFKFRDIDLSAAIQTAMDSGAHTIYLPRAGNESRLTMDQDVNVSATVRRIIGLETNIGGSGRFIIPENTSGEPLIIERIYPTAGGILHQSSRTLAVQNCNTRYIAEAGAGDFYGEDIFAGLEFVPGQSVWIRQLNSECLSPRIRNVGADVWVFGMKTECVGPILETFGGGRSELLGAFLYTSLDESEPGDPFRDFSEPAIVTVDSSVSVAGFREQNFVGTGYEVLVSETRQGEERVILDNIPTVPGQTNYPVASSFQLYVGYPELDPASNEAPTAFAGPDQDLLLTNADRTTLVGFANDDGFPNRGTEFLTEWRQINGPTGGAVIDDVDQVTTIVRFSEAGTYTFQLVAQESDASTALRATDEVTVFVANEAITVAEGLGADTNLRNTTSGEAPTVGIRFGNFGSIGYLRFDISGIEKQDVEAAGLYLDAVNPPVFISDWTFNVFGLVEKEDYGVGRLDEFWSEVGEVGPDGQIDNTQVAVFANAAGLSGASGGVYDAQASESAGVIAEDTVFLGQFNTVQNVAGRYRINTPAFRDFIRADTNGVVTLIISREERSNDGGRRIDLASKESVNRPIPTLQFVVDPDFDDDRIPNTWEIENGYNPESAADALLDLDGDSLTTVAEYAFATQPDVFDTNILAQEFVIGDEGDRSILLSYPQRQSFPSSLRVEYSNDLINWMDAQTQFNGSALQQLDGTDRILNRLTLPSAGLDRSFFRVRIED